ncbi:MAG: ferritin family protein [Candidatus Cloacimonetes bacterium]|jgi:rubrerythrin|nr:ferritin family protein [Candidatus Cloacimonadota bacterium]MDD4155469.1 ferritin family protein [Candidatus Cloacimonadota bacterium]
MTRQEALIMAIENEIKAQNFYKFMGNHCENKSCNLFFNLVPLEKIHEEKLRNIFIEEFPDTEILIKSDIMPTFNFEDKDFRDPKVIYELGIQKEKEAQQLYLSLSEKSTDKKVKEIFTLLAEEEAKHSELLSVEIERLTNTMIWFDESELNGLMED